MRIIVYITEKETVPEVSSKQWALCGKCYFIYTSTPTWEECAIYKDRQFIQERDGNTAHTTWFLNRFLSGLKTQGEEILWYAVAKYVPVKLRERKEKVQSNIIGINRSTTN